MITDVTKWHYLAVKTLSGVLRGITRNNHGNFYCFNCLHSYTTKNRLKNIRKYVKGGIKEYFWRKVYCDSVCYLC